MVSWIKPVLISTGFVAMGMHLMVIVFVAVDFSQAPILLSSFLSWLKPPYLYVITNVIIIIIVGSSRYYRSIASHDGKDEEVSYGGDYKFHAPRRQEAKVVDLNANFSFFAPISPSIVKEESERPVVTERLSETAAVVKEEMICLEVVAESEILTPVEKPLVTARIGHRKLVKKTTAAERKSVRALRVAKPRQHETLENTWKLITEGKPAPLTSHYRRPDTFGLGDGDSNETNLKKAETFKDRSKYYLSPAVSRSRDELNLRADAFIKKCNEERFESMRQDKEVVMARRGLSF